MMFNNVKKKAARSNLSRPSFVMFYLMLLLAYSNIYFDKRFDLPFVIQDSLIRFSPTQEVSFAIFRLLFYATVFLFPMTFSIGEIQTKNGSIKQILSKYALYVSVIGLLASAAGLVMGEYNGATRLCGIISLVCFLYYCLSGRYKGILITFAFIILLYINNETIMLDLPFGIDCYWFQFLMNEGDTSLFISDVWGPCGISHFTCMNVCVCSLANVVEFFLNRRKAEH